MSEIKRYDPTFQMVEDPLGDYVEFTDHEADLIKAKIAVLEELLGIRAGGLAWRLSVSDRIDQLQAQLGEAGR